MTRITDTLQQSVLVFSQNYLPINQINIKRAIALLVTGKAEPIDYFCSTFWEVRSPSTLIQVPVHIRLYECPERFWKPPKVSRRELLRRDKHQCQYCGSKYKLTIDHVIPRCQGGKDTWENLVIACAECNWQKGNRTPSQAGMSLKTKPKAPMHPSVAFAAEIWAKQKLDFVN
ncbi:MAG: HNH endonuclease [Cyanobacteria bacterium J083]|nr:MAG: HNH endonuclease [Cyanobacteria bacterium J083]